MNDHRGSTVESVGVRIDSRVQCELAQRLWNLSIDRWGASNATILIGSHLKFRQALDRVVRLAASDQPILLFGETGAGKELFARAVFLSSKRIKKTFLTVNCAQYRSEHLIASELFGHVAGSFTGAVGDHRGVFEEADGGVLLLDEISELPLQAQAMLLRAVAEGEILPVGGARPRKVDVRLIAATNRDLRPMINAGTFRKDLYYRLSGHLVRIPPLRERGNDWELIATYFLAQLGDRHGTTKRFSFDAMRSLRRHDWPGNVREVRNLVDVGFHLSRSEVIDLRDIGEMLEQRAQRDQLDKMLSDEARRLCGRMINGLGTFWDVVHGPYLDRELNRTQVREVISFGLRHLSSGSYKKLLLRLGVAESDYLKAMDFLRHHRLKPRTTE